MEFEKVEHAPYTNKRPRGELKALIQDFIDSGFESAQLFGWENDYADAQSYAAVLSKIKWRMGCDYIRVSRVLDNVYLINMSVTEKKMKQSSRMRFEEVEYVPFPRTAKRPRGELRALIQDFVDSGRKAVELLDWEKNYKSATSCAAAFLGAVQRFGFDHVRVSRVRNKVYLFNMR